MLKDLDGGQAFPSCIPEELEDSSLVEWKAHKGMSLRDYFAGQAIQGATREHRRFFSAETFETMASDAYGLADAMLVERTKFSEASDQSQGTSDPCK
jgi:hypothetical protein